MRDQVSTQELLANWIEGQQEAAFEALFRRYQEPIYRLLYRLVGDEAQDLTQEVFLRLYHRPPRKPEADLGAWLYRVATRLGYNALRAERRWRSYRDRLGKDTGGSGWLDSPPDPQGAVERHQARQAVRRALSRLSRREASLLVLRYGGLRYREIAEVLGLSANSIGTLLARAERAFAEVYEEAAQQVN